MNSQTANHSYASHDIGAGTEARLNDIHVIASANKHTLF
ncbi:hypothetical protein LINPERHAP2_LOCUS41821 [Linum perenne]